MKWLAASNIAVQDVCACVYVVGKVCCYTVACEKCHSANMLILEELNWVRIVLPCLSKQKKQSSRSNDHQANRDQHRKRADLPEPVQASLTISLLI